jgi:hypothetical protein
MRLLILTLAAVLGFLAGCASSGAITNAVVNTAVAASASAVSRAQGNCVASCPEGTACNHETGYCDVLPCRGRCSTFEECVVHPGGLETCERKGTSTPLKIETRVAPKKADAPASDAPTAQPSDAPTK